MTPFFQVYHQEGDSHVFCYRTGLTVYEEELRGGVLYARGYNGAGYPLNVLTNCPTQLLAGPFAEPFAFNLEINGRSIDRDLIFEDFSTTEDESACHATLTLKSALMPVRVKVHTVLDGTQMFTRYLELENLSDEPMCASRLVLLGGGLESVDRAELADPTPDEPLYSLGYFENASWGREGEFAWRDLPNDTTAIDFRFFRERYRHPMMMLKNKLTGGIWFSQIAFSGGCRYSFDCNEVDASTSGKAAQTHLSFKAELLADNPMLVLEQGEIYTLPAVHMGYLIGGLDDAVNAMHSHVRKSVLNLPEADCSACLVGAGMGAEHDMSVQTTKSFIDQFAAMGAEVLIVDAGWQNPPAKEMEWVKHNGINHPDPDRYPNGISEIVDYCHEKGMKFGLWVEIERLGEYAPARTEHPEWALRSVYGDNVGYLDFNNPDAARWAEDELARIISEYRLDLLRVDYNVSAKTYFNMRDRGTGIKESLSIRHFEAVYRMYQNLKKRFPNVLFENCAGGGGRTDLGMMKAFHHTWVSDMQKLPHSVMITNGMTMALPPERVDRLFAGMGCHKRGTIDAHMRNTMLGHISLNVIAPAATIPNPEQMEFVQHSVQLYKDFIRPILPTCNVYHHTPEIKKTLTDGFTVLEIASPNRSRGAMTVFSMPGCKQSGTTVKLRGIDPAARYRVTLDNLRTTFEAEGRELAVNGIGVEIPAAMSSELVLYEAIEK